MTNVRKAYGVAILELQKLSEAFVLENSIVICGYTTPKNGTLQRFSDMEIGSAYEAILPRRSTWLRLLQISQLASFFQAFPIVRFNETFWKLESRRSIAAGREGSKRKKGVVEVVVGGI